MGGAFVTAWLFQAPSWAADYRFHYATVSQELYTEDVFQTGKGSGHDFITSFRLGGSLTNETARSSTRVECVPEYFDYAEFSQLNHTDVRVMSSWRFTPGRRSVIGVGQGFAVTSRQSGFGDVEGQEGVPVVPAGRRVTWSLDPFYSLELTRAWRLETLATYRAQRFDSPGLVGGTQVGLRFAATKRAGRFHRIGGRVRGDAFRFGDLPGWQDRFVSAEALLSREDAGEWTWNAGTGLSHARGEGFPTTIRPTLHLSLVRGRGRSQVAFGYDQGYSTYGGLGGAARSRSVELSLVRRWFRALQTSIRSQYVERDPLDDPSAIESRVEGYTLGLDVSYRWASGLGLHVQHGVFRQDRSGAARLDYREASLALSYVPRSG